MHLTLGKTPFLRELNLIQGVVEKKSTIPILSNVLLEASGNGVWIKGTDLDISISTWCEAEVKTEGAVCIQAKKLFEIVRALPDAEIEIKRGENEQVNIVCERSKFKMMGLAKDNFPEIQEFDGPYVSIPADLIKTFINRTVFAITNEESRYALNGAKCEINENGVRMVATDGHRLAFIEKPIKLGLSDKVDVLIPKKTLNELGRLSAETDDPIDFGRGENHLFFKVGKRLLVSRTLSGQFPNYDLVIPKENTNSVSIENARISSAIKRVALMADEKSHAIKFDLSEGQIQISSQAAEVGEAGEILPVEYAGPPITVGFNAQYLLDFFNVIQDGDVIFDFKDGSSQAQLRAKSEVDFDYKYIVMPMRL